MIAQPRFRLTTRILLLALGNITLLALMFLAFVRWQLGQDFESFLMTTARERILSETRSIALEMRDSDASTWNQILADHSATHGVTFALYRGEAEQVAGPKLNLPPELKERMMAGPPPGRGRQWDGPPPPARVLAAMGAGPFLLSASRGEFNYWVSMRTFVPSVGEGGRPARGLLVIASPNLLTNPFFFQLGPWLLIGFVAVGVSLLCWLPLVRGLTQSIVQMTEATAKIAEGDFDTQLRVKRHDELGLLGASINRMAARLGAFTHGQKRFLGDVAHELRSPLGRMQLALGILDRKVDAS
ncbi:MAG: HAMP domain-containing protein, partial [Acidobacteria bacterium]|nr:HAMP domain-containing protein [Acidobacteriota bacterium]